MLRLTSGFFFAMNELLIIMPAVPLSPAVVETTTKYGHLLAKASSAACSRAKS